MLWGYFHLAKIGKFVKVKRKPAGAKQTAIQDEDLFEAAEDFSKGSIESILFH